ncbi:MAG: hypothetical protein AB1505_23450 [Candidatus Latescibacterota bacterium]
MLGAAGVAAVSWLDDRRPLPALLRLAVHAACAGLVVGAFLATGGIPAASGLPRTILAAAALLWMVGLTNAYNFMDGIDGMAATQAVVAGAAWCLLGWWHGGAGLALLGALLAATSLGFLGHNWAPARVYMGDVGSTFLGYSFAALALWGAAADWRLLVAGVLFVWPFVWDTGLTLLCRAWRRENILAAHRSHLYQRLVIAGASHTRVTGLYALLALAGVACGLLICVAPDAWGAGPGLVLVLGSALWLGVRRRERR